MPRVASGWITPLCPAGHLLLKGGDWLHRRPTRSRHPERREERSQRRKGVWLVPPQRGTTPGRKGHFSHATGEKEERRRRALDLCTAGRQLTPDWAQSDPVLSGAFGS